MEMKPGPLYEAILDHLGLTGLHKRLNAIEAGLSDHAHKLPTHGHPLPKHDHDHAHEAPGAWQSLEDRLQALESAVADAAKTPAQRARSKAPARKAPAKPSTGKASR